MRLSEVVSRIWKNITSGKGPSLSELRLTPQLANTALSCLMPIPPILLWSWPSILPYTPFSTLLFWMLHGNPEQLCFHVFKETFSTPPSGLFQAIKDPASHSILVWEHWVKRCFWAPSVLSQQQLPLSPAFPHRFLRSVVLASLYVSLPSLHAGCTFLKSCPVVSALLTHLCKSFPWGTVWHCTKSHARTPLQPDKGSLRHSATKHRAHCRDSPPAEETSEETLGF